MARSILSLGMDSALAAMMAVRSRGLWAGSGRPDLAATVISRDSLAKSLERSLSCFPLRNMMFLNWLWPAMMVFSLCRAEILGPGASFQARPPWRRIALIFKHLICRSRPMTTLATDPLTLIHLAISLGAILTGFPVLVAMMKGRTPVTLTGICLGLTV